MSQSHDPDDDQTRVTPTSPPDTSTDDGAFAYLERDNDGPRSHEPTQPLPQDTYDTRPIPTQAAPGTPTQQGQWGTPPTAPHGTWGPPSSTPPTHQNGAWGQPYAQPVPQQHAPQQPASPNDPGAAPWGVPPDGTRAPRQTPPPGAWQNAPAPNQWAALPPPHAPQQHWGTAPAAAPQWGQPTQTQQQWGHQPVGQATGQPGWGPPAQAQSMPTQQQWGQQPVVRPGWGQVPPATMPAAHAVDIDTTPTRAGRLAAWLTTALAAIAIIGCFGTWAHAGVSGGGLGEYDVTVNGFGYGSAHNTRGAYDIGVGGMTIGYVIVIASVLAIVLATLRALGRLSRGPMWVATGLMGLGGILTLVQVIALGARFASVKRALLDLSPTIDYSASSGWGLTLAIVATLAATAAAAVSAVKR